MKQRKLKAYVAVIDDLESEIVNDTQRKVTCHILPAHAPLSLGDRGLITMRHALVHLVATDNKQAPAIRPTSIGYAFFIIYPGNPTKGPTGEDQALPTSIDSYSAYHSVPVLPVTLDAVLIAPSGNAFRHGDSQDSFKYAVYYNEFPV